MRTTFVVGRRTRQSTTVLVLRIENGPILGPWTLKAVISNN
jgi:hypothetical protein